MVVSTVRNNQKMGRHALGIVADRRLMNVLLSRAKHKLVLVTSTVFLKNAVQWSEPGRRSGHELEFLRALLQRIDQMAATDGPESLASASIIACGEDGKVIK